ncbi:hypothetical protein BDZ89DRAFT_1154005 [Hymenopellis radicata]|nr:hypothetical protein BDZ89DRAFT_1154005 [Hymenopellis radicata]
MFIPFISSRTTARNERRRLERRKGGGAAARAAQAALDLQVYSTSTFEVILQFLFRCRTHLIYKHVGDTENRGGIWKWWRPVTTISAGNLFAGRSQGGGTRNQVYGTSAYGSGYPGVSGRGVDNRNFPFYFWPLAWGGVGFGGASYLHTNQYGHPNNSSRPGGAMTYATFPSTSGNTTFFVVSDNTTVASLITDIKSNCSSSDLNTDKVSSAPIAYKESDSTMPQPESTIQYYRASSVSLTLDGYNNSAAFEAEGTKDTPLPSSVDTTLLNCLNLTIGAATPLIDGALPRWDVPNVGVIAMIFVLYHLCPF